jgi:hypothetical protein
LSPPSGVAKVSQPSRRYRGLTLVTTPQQRTAAPVDPNSLKQAQAIVAQVDREIERQANRGLRPSLVPSRNIPPSSMSATRLIQAMFPPRTT